MTHTSASQNYSAAEPISQAQTVIRTFTPTSVSQSDVKNIERPLSAPPLDLRLFNNIVQLSDNLSQVSMHLAQRWRASLFRQVKGLLASENWSNESSEIVPASFTTFLRFIIHALPNQLPSLGVSQRGNVLASWKNAEKMVSIEFMAKDIAHAILTKPTERDHEAVSWRGNIADLKNFIERFGNLDCIRRS